jgi:phytoene dehydrogenase-like protein
MAANHDVLIIGAGHNGLVCGTYLAKAGLSVCLLERRDIVGGAVVSEEVWPGYKISVASFVMSLLQPRIILDLELKAHGLDVIPIPPTFQPFPDGRHLILWPDTEKASAEIAKFSLKDAAAYPDYIATLGGMVPFLRRLLWEIPFDPVSGRFGDVLKALNFAWRYRDVGRRLYDIYDLLTLSAHDFLSRWFESPQVMAALGSYASGSGGNISPMSPGSAYVLARTMLRDNETAAGGWGLVRGGMGSITQAILASGRRHGLLARTGCVVQRIIVRGGRAVGVALQNGEEIYAKTIVSNASAQMTFQNLLEPGELAPDFLSAVKRFRTKSSCFKINVAMEKAPRYPMFQKAGIGFDYPAATVIAPSVDYLERAFDESKHGGIAQEPYLWVLVPSMLDPTLAPPGKHVVSIFGGHVAHTLKEGSWDNGGRQQLWENVLRTISQFAPDFGAEVIDKQILTPVDIERIFALPGGHVQHGEISLDQIFMKRPVPGFAAHRAPIAGLYICGASAHPGGGVTGVPGHNAAKVILKDLRR